jgi:hypothetical protein
VAVVPVVAVVSVVSVESDVPPLGTGSSVLSVSSWLTSVLVSVDVLPPQEAKSTKTDNKSAKARKANPFFNFITTPSFLFILGSRF